MTAYVIAFSHLSGQTAEAFYSIIVSEKLLQFWRVTGPFFFRGKSAGMKIFQVASPYSRGHRKTLSDVGQSWSAYNLSYSYVNVAVFSCKKRDNLIPAPHRICGHSNLMSCYGNTGVASVLPNNFTNIMIFFYIIHDNKIEYNIIKQ